MKISSLNFRQIIAGCLLFLGIVPLLSSCGGEKQIKMVEQIELKHKEKRLLKSKVAPFRWWSLDKIVASVTENGEVEGGLLGKTEVHAKGDKGEHIFQVTVISSSKANFSEPLTPFGRNTKEVLTLMGAWTPATQDATSLTFDYNNPNSTVKGNEHLQKLVYLFDNSGKLEAVKVLLKGVDSYTAADLNTFIEERYLPVKGKDGHQYQRDGRTVTIDLTQSIPAITYTLTQSAEQKGFDPAFASGELPYLRLGQPQEADAYEKYLGARELKQIPKIGNIYIAPEGSTKALYFRGTLYVKNVAAAFLTQPIVRINQEFVDFMSQHSFKDYGTNMIQDGEGKIFPCRVFWSAKYKIVANFYDIQKAGLKQFKSVSEFAFQDREPEKKEEPEPVEDMLDTQAIDFPKLDFLHSKYETLPKAEILAAEQALGIRRLDEDASDNESLYFVTVEESKSNAKAVMYFYDSADKSISEITLDCSSRITKPETLTNEECKAWMLKNGFTFIKGKEGSGKVGAIYYNATAKVQAYIYIKNSNGACFISLTKQNTLPK